MNVAFVIYDGVTLLDFAGMYDPITRLKREKFLPDLQWDVCAMQDSIADGENLVISSTQVKKPLNHYDIVLVPGARIKFIDTLIVNKQFLTWLNTASSVKLLGSVCTGSILLGAAGMLTNATATTHPNHLQTLKKYCDKVSTKRIVKSNNVITAGGVTSAIDLGLYLCEYLANKTARSHIEKLMDYNNV